MQAVLLQTAQLVPELMSPVNSVVFFAPYIQFLKKQIKVWNGMKPKF